MAAAPTTAPLARVADRLPPVPTALNGVTLVSPWTAHLLQGGRGRSARELAEDGVSCPWPLWLLAGQALASPSRLSRPAATARC